MVGLSHDRPRVKDVRDNAFPVVSGFDSCNDSSSNDCDCLRGAGVKAWDECLFEHA